MKNKILILVLLLFAFSAFSYLIYFKKETKVALSQEAKTAVSPSKEEVKKPVEKPAQLTEETLSKKVATQAKATPSAIKAKKPAEKTKILLAKKTYGKIKKGTRVRHITKKAGKRLKKPSQEIVKVAKAAPPKTGPKKPVEKPKTVVKHPEVPAQAPIVIAKTETTPPVVTPAPLPAAIPEQKIEKTITIKPAKEEADRVKNSGRGLNTPAEQQGIISDTTKQPVEKLKPAVAEKPLPEIKKESSKPAGEPVEVPPVQVSEAVLALPEAETVLPVTEPLRPAVAPQKVELLKEAPVKPVETPKTAITARPSPEIKKETVVVQLKEEPKKPVEKEPQKEITAALPKADNKKPAEPVVVPSVQVPQTALALPKAETVLPVIPPTPLIPAAAPVVISQKEGRKLSPEEKAYAGTKKKIALLPFENFTDSKDALSQVTPLLKSRLEKKGLGIVDEDNLNKLLCNERVRATGHISRELAQKIEKELSANAIMAGAIISYSSGENPQISLLARLIDPFTGLIIWANYASVTGDDFTTILGLGRISSIEDLTSRAVDILLTSFNTSPPQKDPESLYRIAVMPFQNKSKYKSAGVIATYMFLVELFKNEIFEPVEYGDVKKIVVELKIRDKSEIDYKTMEALSKRSGAGGILLGTVEQFSESTDASSPPKVTMTARLLDARKNKILWYNTQQSNGENDIIAFEWAEKKPVDRVAYKAVSELVKKMRTAKWQ
ncbi:MAG: hypothetical protein HZB61_00530 [Nitrospirae bacterium]|nr:hypothetical protein [Nitrospirota bacterium]